MEPIGQGVIWERAFLSPVAVVPKHTLGEQTFPVLRLSTDKPPKLVEQFVIVVLCWHKCCRSWSLLPGEVRGEDPHPLADSTEAQGALLQPRACSPD